MIECDYRLNEGSANAFTFASQPVTETLSAIESNIWIAGIWSNAKSRTALRTGGAYNTDWVSMVESSDVESC